MPPGKSREPKVSEVAARLIITGDGTRSYLAPRSSKADCDIILAGKGSGKVYVEGLTGNSPVLTVDSLGDLDELAAALAGITIDGADPAAVLALEATLKDLISGFAKKSGASAAEAVKAVYDAIAAGGNEPLAQAILDAFGGKPNATVADLITYIAAMDNSLSGAGLSASTALTATTDFLTAVAGNPDPSQITIAGGGIVGLAVTAWDALVAQVAAGGDVQQILDGVTGINGATVQDFVDTVRSYGSGTNNVMLGLAALFDAIVGKPGATFEEVEEVFANGFGGNPADLQPLLDILSANPGSGTGTLASVEAVMQALSDVSTMVYLLVNALSGKPNGTGSVAEVLPFLQQAITSVVEFNLAKPFSGPLQVATTVTAGVSGDTAEIVAFSPDARPANLDLQAPGGTVTVNGAAIALLSQYQALINALCSAPLTGMSGTTVTSVGTWAAIIKQELESLGANLQTAYDKTVENKNAIAALFTENTALTTENTALKKRLDDLEYAVRELSAGNAAGLVSQTAFDGFAQSIGGEINTLSNTVDALLAAGSGAALIDGGTPFDDDGSPLAAAAAAGFNMDDLVKLLSGGKDVPRNVDWTVCQNLEGTGNVEARMLNGVVQMRGTLTYTHTSASTSTIIGELPVGVQPPATDSNYTVWANETGVGQKIGAVRISTRGRISVSAPTGPFNSITFNSITYPAF